MNVPRVLMASIGALTAAPALASGGADGSSLLSPNGGTIFWTVLTFVLLLLLLRRVAWGPLLSAIDAREKGIRDTLDQAKNDREEAQALLQQHHELLAQARRDRAAAVDQGKRDAERARERIMTEAQQQREQLLADTQAQIEAGMRRAREDLRATAAELAILAAGKLLNRNLDDPAQRRLVEEHLADLERSGGSALPN